jgi:uncharacterized protein (DUF983 family)
MKAAQTITYNPQHSGNFMHVLQGRCPRCGEGKFFESSNPYSLRHMLETKKECSHCHLNFDPEPGFYWGATYASYAFTVAFSVFTFLVSTVIFGFMNSLNLTYVAVNAALLVVISPISFRFGRIFWLWLFYNREEV